MSLADELFIENCRDIIANGVSDEECHVRPHWEDGTPYDKEILYREPL